MGKTKERGRNIAPLQHDVVGGHMMSEQKAGLEMEC